MSYKTITLPAPLLDISNAFIPYHSSQEQTLGITLHNATHAVTWTTLRLLPANAHLVLPSSSFTDCSHASPSPLSTISSSIFDPPLSSPCKSVPIPHTSPLKVSSNVHNPTNSSPLQPLFGLVSLEDSNVPIPPHWTLQVKSQEQNLGVTLYDLGSSSTLDLTLAHTLLARSPEVSLQFPSAQWLLYLVPQLLEVQDHLLVYEALSTLMPRLHVTSLPSSLSSSPHSACLDILFVFVTAAVLFSTFLVASKTFSTLMHKSWTMNDDLNSTHQSGNFAYRSQLVHHAPRPTHLVFDPGGVVVVPVSHEIVRKRKSRMFAILSSMTLPLPSSLSMIISLFSVQNLRFFSSCS
jgi:hypothetical protein